ncbi:hypothetical protein [Roseinatronobacter monicus]|uniref:Uncharacterized protein n=1 Tax=Roseinatronobacter monicus TaxID=393481 RepID=A0A543K3S5_9RHOB|nr:hypothetical protein [Roseinatronobacter monicus]TQM89684.1 hypothetical protein BD293_4354 [Roseinatronobacter monicus]
MSHKSKICSTALTSHIETCREECSYTPLIVRNNSFTINDFSHEGIASVIGAEVSAIAEEKGRDIDEVEAKFHEQYRAISEQEALGKRLLWRETLEKLRPAFADLVSDQVSEMRSQLRA